MTPEQHAKAIEDAAIVFKTLSNIFEQRPNTIGQVPGALRAMERIQAAIRAAVGAAPDSNLPTYTDDLELRYVEACEERDHLRQLLPRDGWQLVPKKLDDGMVKAGGHANSEWLNDNAPIGETRYAIPMPSVWAAMLAAAPKP